MGSTAACESGDEVLLKESGNEIHSNSHVEARAYAATLTREEGEEAGSQPLVSEGRVGV